MCGSVSPLPPYAFVAWRETTSYILCEQKRFGFPHTIVEGDAVFSGINIPTFQRNLLRVEGVASKRRQISAVLRRRIEQANVQQSLTCPRQVHQALVAPRFDPRPVHVGFVVDKVAMGPVMVTVLQFLQSVSFHKSSRPVFHFLLTLMCGKISGVYCIV